MADVLGVALESGVVRAAMRSNGQLTLAEVSWDPSFPEAAVDALRAKFGSVSGIVLSVGFAFLEIAEPELPPLAGSDRRRVMLRDADRYFPVDGAIAISPPSAAGVAFATSGDRLHRWKSAFDAWAPVRAIVASPYAIATGLSAVHRAAPDGVRMLLVDASPDELGFVRLKDSQMVEARRLPMELRASLPSAVELLNDVYLPGAAGVFASALGAIELATVPFDEMLLDDRIESEMRGRRARRQAMSMAALVATVVMLGLAIDARHDRALRVHQVAVDSLHAHSQPARIAQSRLADLDRERVLLAARGAAGEPLGIVATLSQLLPSDAFVERVNWDGVEWRIDGSTNSAADIVTSLDSASLFSNVRVLTASTRFRDGSRMRESFSVAFRVKGETNAAR
ncbi:MAG: PilN domain-containing protein [Phycisphaerae bacterium]|nr:PilN domain-containing protein [Gemmatimonadaceae bacterium]